MIVLLTLTVLVRLIARAVSRLSDLGMVLVSRMKNTNSPTAFQFYWLVAQIILFIGATTIKIGITLDKLRQQILDTM